MKGWVFLGLRFHITMTNSLDNADIFHIHKWCYMTNLTLLDNTNSVLCCLWFGPNYWIIISYPRSGIAVWAGTSHNTLYFVIYGEILIYLIIFLFRILQCPLHYKTVSSLRTILSGAKILVGSLCASICVLKDWVTYMLFNWKKVRMECEIMVTTYSSFLKLRGNKRF